MGKCRISIGERGAKSTHRHECCIVIDVLRASSTIVTALAHGVEEITPVIDIIHALKLKKKRYTTAGERNGFKLPGFDLGNSPTEILTVLHHNPIRKMALTTSNLTRVMAHCDAAYICSSLNLTAVSSVVGGQNVNIVAVGGQHGVVEDLGVALALMMRLQGIKLQNELIKKMITHSPAARYLTSIGYGDDVKFITRIGIYPVVPLYQSGTIRCGTPRVRIQR